MAPIRLGLIGLSSSAVTSWASDAHLPYLLSPRGRSKYTITALCNSSVDSAKAAIQHYGLDPATTRAYGDAADLAADPDVDLVVCCTRVDTHYALSRPSVEAGKHVFVEWPLTHDVESARHLASLAADRGVSSVVGLQGRLTPVVVRMRELLRSGDLGRVLSSHVQAYGGTIDRQTLAEGLSYFTDRRFGGNIFMIGFGHREYQSRPHLDTRDFWLIPILSLAVFDQVQSVLGEVTEVQSHLQLQRPEVSIRDSRLSSGKIVGSLSSDVPDLIHVTGSLRNSEITKGGATLAVRYRRGQPFKGEPALTWHINCERGELRMVCPGGSSLQTSAYSEPVTIDIHQFAGDEVRSEAWEWPSWQEEVGLPVISRSIAILYEAFHHHVSEGGARDFPDFSDALERQQQLDSILSKWTPQPDTA